MISPSNIRLLNKLAAQYNHTRFIADDPISIPHRFHKKQDIEISAFFTSMLAWGRRSVIMQNASRLMLLMDNAPHEFILQHEEKDLKAFLDFKHRTFQTTDLLYFIDFLKRHYSEQDSLEQAFSRFLTKKDQHIGPALEGFAEYFFEAPYAPTRTRKHIPSPLRNSACKRQIMFLRWMVRKDDRGVDFGLWNKIKPAQLLCPLDVHVDRIARRMGLLERTQSDWKAVLELGENLRRLDPEDPAKYDFALFGMGVLENQSPLQPK